MKKVDYAMKQLRLSSTVNAMQKASVKVAVSLLDLVAQSECHNPFLCLHQAAMYAGQGPKRGNNDEPFKRALPSEKDCSPLEALVILGRADCMRAVHFTDEALFLCSYVAQVCCRHRDREQPEFPWSPQWRVIGVQTYIVSAAIDSTISSIREEGRTYSWDSDAKDEIARGRSDAIALKRLSDMLTVKNHRNLPRWSESKSDADIVDRNATSSVDSADEYDEIDNEDDNDMEDEDDKHDGEEASRSRVGICSFVDKSGNSSLEEGSENLYYGEDNSGSYHVTNTTSVLKKGMNGYR